MLFVQKMKEPDTFGAGFFGYLSQSGQYLADTLHSALITQDLHNGVQVGGVGLAGDSLTDEGGDICHSAGEGIGISLVGLHIGGKAHLRGDGLDFLKPNAGIVGDVELLQELFQCSTHSFLAELLVKDGLFQILVIEEAHVRLGFLPGGNVLAGLFAASAAISAGIARPWSCAVCTWKSEKIICVIRLSSPYQLFRAVFSSKFTVTILYFFLLRQ